MELTQIIRKEDLLVFQKRIAAGFEICTVSIITKAGISCWMKKKKKETEICFTLGWRSRIKEFFQSIIILKKNFLFGCTWILAVVIQNFHLIKDVDLFFFLLRHVDQFPTRSWNGSVRCIRNMEAIHWTTREVPRVSL